MAAKGAAPQHGRYAAATGPTGPPRTLTALRRAVPCSSLEMGCVSFKKNSSVGLLVSDAWRKFGSVPRYHLITALSSITTVRTAWSKGLVWLIGTVMCLLPSLRVRLSISAGDNWPRNALRYHAISCHFRDCKALLLACLTDVGAL